MQPYIFPYIGYFQLMSAVDKFIFYDDVRYANNKWVNRNKIILNGEEHYFTIPLNAKKQSTLIKDLKLNVDKKWIKKFRSLIRHAYHKDSYFDLIYPMINEIIEFETEYLIDWQLYSFEKINSYLKIDTSLKKSSYNSESINFNGQDRIIKICIDEKANTYINPFNGKSLYNNKSFEFNKIKLKFLESKPHDNNISKTFSNSSILDILMKNNVAKIRLQLQNYIIHEL